MNIQERDWLNPEKGRAHVLLDVSEASGDEDWVWLALEIGDCTRHIALDFSFKKGSAHTKDEAFFKINKLREYLDKVEKVLKNIP